jgi:hypothetical protein
MRLHPAVATALVLVGGVLLALPVDYWLRFAADFPTGSSVPLPLVFASLLSGLLGLVFILGAVVSSFEPRSGSGGPT